MLRQMLFLLFGWIHATVSITYAQEHYAVLIGVEKYDTSTFRNLDFAGDDAIALSAQLQQLGFKTTVMTGESDSSKLQPTTPAKILATIKAVGRSCSEDDAFVIALSGHGVQFADDEVLPSGARESYFCPADADLNDKSTLLKISTVVEAMNETKATRKLLLVDACQDQKLSAEGKKKGGKLIDLGSVHENRTTVPGGISIIFSCSDKQFSWEHDPLGHSVFSYHLLQYLKGAAESRYYDEGRLDLFLMLSYVAKHTNDYVIQNNLTPDGQYPVMLGKTSTWTFGKRHPNPARLTNSLKMEFARIPAGAFVMGSKLSARQVNELYPGGKEEYYQGETQHEVELSKPFYMGIHEVTVGQFRKFVEEDNYKTEAEMDTRGGLGIDQSTGQFIQSNKYSWRSPGFEQGEHHPVVNVSWNDAIAFCRWLSRVEGREYRLPTEAEWEYSCRAGSTSEFSFGGDAEQIVDFDNVADATLKRQFPKSPTVRARDGIMFTSRVGGFRANPFGLYDMHGNVSEWCADWYGEYSSGKVRDPVGPLKGESRVVRGGGWNYFFTFCRSAFRDGHAPESARNSTGFRVVLDTETD